MLRIHTSFTKPSAFEISLACIQPSTEWFESTEMLKNGSLMNPVAIVFFSTELYLEVNSGTIIINY